MTARLAWISLSVLLLTPLVRAQAAPPEVEQALRARVTEFLQYHVDGNFRKAYDMVAEGTKDQYFNTGKVKLQSFTVDDIKFTDNFTRATVTATMAKTVNVAGLDIPVALPSTITWKIENGKWVWYDDASKSAAWSTPVGLTSAGAAAAAPRSDDTVALPKDFNDKSIAAAAQSILQQVSVDKKEITLSADRTSEGKVVFHNGLTGSVQLELSAPQIPGFSVKLDQSIARAAADVPVVFRYEPEAAGADHIGPTRDSVNVQIMVQPLNQIFVIHVNFAASPPLK